MRGTTVRGVLVTLSGIGLAGCASLGSVPGVRSHAHDPGTLQVSATMATAHLDETAWPTEDWWRTFADPQLDQIEAEALAGNPSLSIAQARVDRASAAVGAIHAKQLPSADADFSATRERFSNHDVVPPPFGGSSQTESRLALDFGYEFDFWGKNRAALAAALDDAAAARVDAFAARLVLASAVAGTYVQLAQIYDQLDIDQRTLQQRQQIYDLTQQLVSAGLGTRVELKQAEAELPVIRESIAALAEAEARTRNQLAALMGEGPDRGQAIQPPKLHSIRTEATLPSRLSMDLLGRRPDVQASRLRAQAAAQSIKVAKARFYPDVNLIAFLGFQSIGLSQLLEAGSHIAGVGPAVRLPLFEGGQLRSELAGRHADYDAAVEQYNQTLVEALREIADQLAAWRSVTSQTKEHELAIAAARDAYDLSVQRYREGVGTYLTVLSAETLVLQQEHLGADLRARELADRINLIRALGGGFQPPPSPAARLAQGELR
ncbi:MAG TPA: efflux transporter outer membrane subunit [Steroidobacteraceae bacterium]|nr:efflux transporter outer membrane subunit [Steroidobacteraceae bacterium]